LRMLTNRPVQVLSTALAVLFVLLMITHPKEVFAGATTGLQTWWNIVFPALLPFFIASELLMSFGVVHFMGVLLEPIMRPLFNVPGTGSFVMAIGYTSGYPIGAMLTAKLRAQNMVSREEAERLVSFTNNSSPLFMLVAVAVGMFNMPALGYVIAGSHYLGNLTLGLLLRFYRRGAAGKRAPAIPPRGNYVAGAFRELVRVLQAENRPLGRIMGDAVRNAVNNLLNIGGFIILFAVIIRLLESLGFIELLAGWLSFFLVPLGFPVEIMPAVASGLFEMTIGTKMAAQTEAQLLHQLLAVAIILAWSGLSIHAQVVAMLSGTDIRMLLYILSRVVHAALACIYTALMYPVLDSAGLSLPAAFCAGVPGGSFLFAPAYWHYLQACGLSLLGCIVLPLLGHLVLRAAVQTASRLGKPR